MEYWEYKADDGLILQTDPCHPSKNRSQSTKPSIPAFQYSIIPLPLAADSRHSQGALTPVKNTGSTTGPEEHVFCDEINNRRSGITHRKEL
ncbi:hypothetical protein D1AOALGA4SA_10365 [Olavius algarvensis Delta 1 endosymbiont]|nr:hypothetical protein D1AOALGA4SA_10365 [Olavius algarvensis Delta 1 endosymbiont]